MAGKLHVAFVWHMHQPLYKDRLTGKYLMPWVRLHAQKDYLDMLLILRDFPGIKQTFNLVPSLLEQIVDYADNEAWDQALELLVKPVSDWSPSEKEYVFERFFDLNWPNMLKPYPRYAALAEQRERLRGMDFQAVERHFSEADWLDLSVWFNLAWFDPMWLKSDADLRGLVERGAGFDQDDRSLLTRKIRQVMARLVPAYREMAASGQVELTTTPYYHPILPLLCDRDAAHVARPNLPLPAERFQHPEDARAQIARGVAYFEGLFGRRPAGMWPSEQSVSPEALGLIAEAGLKWAISDEGILGRSLGVRFNRGPLGVPAEARALYQPYWVDTPSGRVAMVFRDIVLSDLIGFSYASPPGHVAAADLHGRLTRIRQALPDGEDHLVTIALDGENCWEHYHEDGAAFLRGFYERVLTDPTIALVTVSDYLAQHPPTRTLSSLFSGSWIGSDFTTWIGDPTKNRAWDALFAAREALVGQAARLVGTPEWDAAWEEIYIAEGSDWFWWFGEGHDSGQDELFDWQFRLHLQNAYRLAGLTVPEALFTPITKAAPRPLAAPVQVVAPTIDGEIAEGEWAHAGAYDPTKGQGAMHAAAKVVQGVRYGRGTECLFLAVEFAPHAAPAAGDTLTLYLCYPGQARYNSPISGAPGDAVGLTRDYHFAHAVHVALGAQPRAFLRAAREYGAWEELGEVAEVAFGSALELALPWAAIGQEPGQEVQLVVAATQDGRLAEVVPNNQMLHVVVPELARAR